MKSISPLRYPGGKSRLYEKVLPLIESHNAKEYAEPFSGGFGIGLLLLLKNKVDKVYINDLDKNIYSFWKCIKHDSAFLIKNIKRVNNFISLEQWLDERQKQAMILKSQDKKGYKKRAFATLFLNRVNRSGILLGGPIGGKSQNGKYKINCRFNSQRLIEQIKLIANHREKIQVSNLDYQKFLLTLNINVFVFLDPPYVVKGGNLYMNNFLKKNHYELEKFLRAFKNNWVLTYDQHQLIQSIYNKEQYQCLSFNLNHYAGKFKVGKELFISKA